MLVKCSCKHCGGTVEYEAEEYKYGLEVQCPHCQQHTLVTMTNRRMWYPAPNAQNRRNVPDSTIGLAYLTTLLIPLAGFFFGIYLIAKKEPGHGCGCMFLSFVSSSIWATILFSW
jgi:ssDNA-binding Zn-finger/Zn-ribbon topoisomerase 1